MMDLLEFMNRINNLPNTIPSKTRTAFYTGFRISNDILFFRRVNTGKNWDLNLNVLYDVYKNNAFINTTVVKRETNGKVNSPSVAVLMAIGCLDNDGNRL